MFDHAFLFRAGNLEECSGVLDEGKYETQTCLGSVKRQLKTRASRGARISCSRGLLIFRRRGLGSHISKEVDEVLRALHEGWQ